MANFENREISPIEPSQKLEFSDTAADPDQKSKLARSKDAHYKKGLATKEDIDIKEVDGQDVLKFGGDKNAIKGSDVLDLLAISSKDANGGDFIDISRNGEKPVLAAWMGDFYTYSEGPLKDQKVRFLNGQNYEVTSASERIFNMPPQNKVDMSVLVKAGESVMADAKNGPDINGAFIGASRSDALAGSSREEEIMSKAELKERKALEAKYLKVGEQSGEVAIGFLRQRAKRDYKEKGEGKFPDKLEEMEFEAVIEKDLANKMKLPDGRKALYYTAPGLPGKTLLPDNELEEIAIYNDRDELQSVRKFGELKPKTRELLHKLYS